MFTGGITTVFSPRNMNKKTLKVIGKIMRAHSFLGEGASFYVFSMLKRISTAFIGSEYSGFFCVICFAFEWHRLLNQINVNNIIMGKYGDVSGFMLLLFLINCSILISKVSAYYCNHDLCREDQYCCGDNLCCDYVYSPWYFWAGVVFMILVLSACGGLFRYCYDSNSYIVLHSCKDEYFPTKSAADEDKGLSSVVIKRDAPPAYSVSQYSDTPEDYQRLSAYEQNKHHFSSARTIIH